MNKRHRVVILGGGFGGLLAAQSLKRQNVDITLIDRRNFHLFQPLLYQVATGGLSPADIAVPLRGILKRQKNARVLLAEAGGLDAAARRIFLRPIRSPQSPRGELPPASAPAHAAADSAPSHDDFVEYDTLIVATGAGHNYFGHDDWARSAPGLKTIEDATEIRARILHAFEEAERRRARGQRDDSWLTFVIIGAGPTGVELAGAIAEIARDTLKHDFRHINPRDARILLLDAAERVLPPYPPELSWRAKRSLERLGVTVWTSVRVTDVQPDCVLIQTGLQNERIGTHAVLWAAGVQASPWGRILHEAAGATLDRAGRVCVEPNLTITGHPEIFVIGDLACVQKSDRKPLPVTAPVAMQQGRYVARRIARRLTDSNAASALAAMRGTAADPPFVYQHKGDLATIGRASAVADFGWVRFWGYPAWLLWLFIHILFIVEFENRVLILVQWAWNYWTRNRSARLITGEAATEHVIR